jgi:vacuolar-type H+-ATPase subunit F/Vma7
MGRMVAVGTDRLTQALSAAGFVPEVCAAPAEMSASLVRLSRDPEVALVAVGESQAAEAIDAVRRFREESSAMLLILPDTPTPQRLGYELVRRALEAAAGVDLLSRAAEAGT